MTPREVRKTDEMQTFYVNNVTAEASSFDVQVRLGRIISLTPNELTVNDLAQIYMSPEHFRAFVGLMRSLLAKMEPGALSRQDTTPTFIE